MIFKHIFCPNSTSITFTSINLHPVPNVVSLGAFFSFLSYLVTTLEDKGINKENYKAVLLILFLKASLGGFICLILFHGLDYFFQNMNESLRVGIAGAGAFLTENIKKYLLLFIQKKV